MPVIGGIGIVRQLCDSAAMCLNGSGHPMTGFLMINMEGGRMDAKSVLKHVLMNICIQYYDICPLTCSSSFM